MIVHSGLRPYLAVFLDGLNTASDDKRWTYDDIAKSAELSRTSIYNWMRGDSATAEGLKKLAIGLHKLAKQHDLQKGSSYDDVQQIYSELVSQTADQVGFDPAQIAHAFFNYPPICGAPKSSNGEQKWTFFGTLINNLQLASGLPLRIQSCSGIPDLYAHANESIVVGCFATPERAATFRFIRTPIQIPLNAVVLRRDVSRFLREVLRFRRKAFESHSVEEYLNGLQQALWRRHARNSHTLPGIHEDLMPITARDEAGWTYLRSFHSFDQDILETSSTKLDGGYRYDAQAYFDKIFQASEEFQEKLDRLTSPHIQDDGNGLTFGQPKLPVMIADELTCLEVMRIAANTEKSLKTDLVLLSDPNHDLHLSGIARPRYAISLAIKREVPAYFYNEAKSRFDEFLWSYASTVTQEYVRLYYHLLDVYGSDIIIGNAAPKYFLKWLSLDVIHCPEMRARAGFLHATRNPVDIPELAAWSAILDNARQIICWDRTAMDSANGGE